MAQQVDFETSIGQVEILRQQAKEQVVAALGERSVSEWCSTLGVEQVALREFTKYNQSLETILSMALRLGLQVDLVVAPSTEQ